MPIKVSKYGIIRPRFSIHIKPRPNYIIFMYYINTCVENTRICTSNYLFKICGYYSKYIVIFSNYLVGM